MKNENDIRRYKKVTIIFILVAVLLIGAHFLLRPVVRESLEKKEKEAKYEEMVQFTTDNCDAIIQVSKTVIDNIDYIKENRDYNLERLRIKLDAEENELFDRILDRISYNGNNIYNDRSKKEVYYWCGHIGTTDIILVYSSEDDLDVKSADAYVRLTKIADHLYVIMEEHHYT